MVQLPHTSSFSVSPESLPSSHTGLPVTDLNKLGPASRLLHMLCPLPETSSYQTFAY